MEIKSDFISKLLNKKASGLVVSINDLRDKEFSGVKLSAEEKFALSNFDKYRISVLNSQTEEEKFHYQYRQLQVIANLSDWQEFLGEEFSS
ncbi:MAG TPA: hypothetical protein PL029_00975 [Bacteroidia bacterium]|nr:hypothetical protein [Bacteroidia bacterium]